MLARAAPWRGASSASRRQGCGDNVGGDRRAACAHPHPTLRHEANGVVERLYQHEIDTAAELAEEVESFVAIRRSAT